MSQADDMLDDIETSLFQGDLCDHCGDPIEECDCIPEEDRYARGAKKNEALNVLLNRKSK